VVGSLIGLRNYWIVTRNPSRYKWTQRLTAHRERGGFDVRCHLKKSRSFALRKRERDCKGSNISKFIGGEGLNKKRTREEKRGKAMHERVEDGLTTLDGA